MNRSNRSKPFRALFALFLVTSVLAGPAAVAAETPDEAALVAVLESDAPPAEKIEACRGLKQVGTAASVPALATLLTDPELSHTARYVLESMPAPEAAQALRDALGRAEGVTRAGIAISLGVRRDAEAVGSLASLLKDSNPDVVRAALGALGRIATPEAVETLTAFRAEAPEAIRPALAEALLAAGDFALEDGRRDAAAAVYRTVASSEWPEHVQMGAFRGLVLALPDEAPQRLQEALAGDDPALRGLAAQLIGDAKVVADARVFIEALPELPAAGQAALIRGLADRGDAEARPAVLEATRNSDPEVRLAAVQAMGVLGGADDVPALAELLASDDAKTAEAARAALTGMPGEEVDAALVAILPDAPADRRASLLDLLAAREAQGIATQAAKYLNDSEPVVRIAALRILAPRGGVDLLPEVLRVLKEADDNAERTAAGRTLADIAARGGADALPQLLEALSSADAETRLPLLRAVARVGGPEALDAILAAVREGDSAASAEAVNLLSSWQTLDAAPHLLELAQGDDASRKRTALRGYVRLAENHPSVEERFSMLTTALSLAERPEEKKLVLGAWRTVTAPEALATLRPYLDDNDVRNEAAVAIIAVAGELAKSDGTRAAAAEALEVVAAAPVNDRIRERAQQARADIP